MEAVVRGFVVYVFLLVVFRITGQRSLGQVTTFDFVLLLIVAETIQGALLGQDDSITFAFVLVLTLFAIDVALALVKQRSPRIDRLIEGLPLVIVQDGEPLRDRMDRSRVDDEDVMSAARSLRGLERMDQIKFAVLERNGEISVVPKESALAGRVGAAGG